MPTPTRASELLDEAQLGHAGVSIGCATLSDELDAAYHHARGLVVALKRARDAAAKIDSANAEAVRACNDLRDLQLVIDPRKRGRAAGKVNA